MHTTSPKSLWFATAKVFFSYALHADNFDCLLLCNMCLLILKPKLKKKPHLEHAIFMAQRKEILQNYAMPLKASA